MKLSLEDRQRFRDTANQLIDDALPLADVLDHGNPTSADEARFRSVMQRVRRLQNRASGIEGTPHDFQERSRLFRTIRMLALANGQHQFAMDLCRNPAINDPEVGLIIKAAASAADTSTSGWASEIVASALGEFVPLLRPRSALFALAPSPLPLSGEVTFPRMTTGSSSGFVAEGAGIPLKQNVLSSITMKPYKAAAMVVATAELMKRADAFAEAAIITPLAEDVANGVDAVFLSNSAATAAAPAGLFHGDNSVAALAATVGANAQACASDLANLLAAGAKMVRPVLLINGATAAKATQLAGASDFPLITQLASGRVFNAEVLWAGNLTAGTVALIDAADLLAAGLDQLRIDMSAHSTLHMDDAPNADVLVPASGGIALWQRNMIATAVMMPVTWRVKRTASVQHVTNCTWA